MTIYKLVEGLDLKKIYNIINKRNVVCFESYDSDHYYYYDLSDEGNIPVFLGLLCSDTELLKKLFELKEGMYGVAAKKILVELMNLYQEYPEFTEYVTNIDISLAVNNGGTVGDSSKFVLWLLFKKLQSILEVEEKSSFNVRLAISKIKQVICNFPGYSERMLLPVLFNAGLESVSDGSTFRINRFIESVNEDYFEALPRYSDSFSGTDDMTIASDDSATVALS